MTTPPKASTNTLVAGEVLALPDDLLPCLALFASISKLGNLASLLNRCGYDRCWTARVTLWGMMLAYLLRHKATLVDVFATLSHGVGDALCTPGKELSVLLAKCRSTSGYSQARARLPLPWLRHGLAAQAQSLGELATGWHWHSLQVLLLDGTNVSLRSLGNIPQWFPPASNQHGPTYWCQMRVLGCLCLGTGLMLAVVIGAISESEQSQAVRLILHGLGTRPPTSLLWMGDRNFGVWRVVAATWQSQSHVLVRLTDERARKLAAGHALKAGVSLPVSWAPSRHDKVDRGLYAQAVPGRLLVVSCQRKGFRPLLLLLFTTLTDDLLYPAQAVAALYARRWQIELSFRQIKAQMGLGHLKVKTSVMAKRELYAGLMAYNLVRGVMLLSAAYRGMKLKELSFATAMAQLAETLRVMGTQENAGKSLERLCNMVRNTGQQSLPQRRQPRPSEPRLKRYHRDSFPPLHGSRSLARKLLQKRYSSSDYSKS